MHMCGLTPLRTAEQLKHGDGSTFFNKQKADIWCAINNFTVHIVHTKWKTMI